MLDQEQVIIGDNADAINDAAIKIFEAWHSGEIAIPSGKSIDHFDQTLVKMLKDRGHPGLVLFSSGSTGEPKAALHDAFYLRKKYDSVKVNPKRMLFFMQLDHIGGINTMLHSLASHGTLVTVADRKPSTVMRAIEQYKVQILPTTPTFLNLMLMSGTSNYDLSSLELITYGTETMPAYTLDAAVRAFPNVRFQQTYGLSELGILRSKSRANNSLWVKIGGEGFETRVRDGLLEIKAESAMLGYLNAPSPFTEDGWFMTGDVVEQDGEWLRILGRRSEIINVGGEKVYPAEVESFLLSMPGVKEATVCGVAHPLTGQIVTAIVDLSTGETADEFRKRVRKSWAGLTYAMPISISLASNSMHTDRFKKARYVASAPGLRMGDPNSTIYINQANYEALKKGLGGS